jgi:hypothetical protein
MQKEGHAEKGACRKKGHAERGDTQKEGHAERGGMQKEGHAERGAYRKSGHSERGACRKGRHAERGACRKGMPRDGGGTEKGVSMGLGGRHALRNGMHRAVRDCNLHMAQEGTCTDRETHRFGGGGMLGLHGDCTEKEHSQTGRDMQSKGMVYGHWTRKSCPYSLL